MLISVNNSSICDQALHFIFGSINVLFVVYLVMLLQSMTLMNDVYQIIK